MTDRRNIVLITVDSLRADHCGFMGYDQDTTPYLDTLADESVVFDRAIAPAPFTKQSMPAIFTGQYHTPTRDDYEDHVRKRDTIAERLSRRGYSTAGFSPNPFASRNFGYDDGFDLFEDFFGNDSREKIARTLLTRAKEGDFIEGVRLAANMAGYNVPGIGNQSIPLRSYYDRVTEWVEDASSPFFLWLFLLEVHSPYRPTPEYRVTSLPRMLYLNLVRSYLFERDPTPEEIDMLYDLYDGTIRMVDDLVEGLMTDLSSYDPVLVFTSDHGEAFGEHGDIGHNEHLYEENLHVPLVVSNAASSGRTEEPVSLRQLPRMVEEIADTGRVSPSRYTTNRVVGRTNGKLAVTGNGTKHILNVDGADEHYDLNRDPVEQASEVTDGGGAIGRTWLDVAHEHTTTERERDAITRAIDRIEVE